MGNLVGRAPHPLARVGVDREAHDAGTFHLLHRQWVIIDALGIVNGLQQLPFEFTMGPHGFQRVPFDPRGSPMGPHAHGAPWA